MGKKREQIKESAAQRFRDRKLTYKISVAVGLLLTFFLTLMVIVSASIAARFLSSSISGEFDGIAIQNGLSVQAVIDTASTAATTLQDYITDKYDEYNKNGYSGETAKSEVYDVELQEMNKEMEEFMISVARSTVTVSEGIAGVGVFFEPNAFDPAIKDYTVYVSESDAKTGNVQSYGAYTEYGSQDYYKNAATTKQNCFTDPYYDQGINMVSASFPITYQGKVEAVILVDINISTFKNLRSSDSDYKTMYVDIFTGDGTFIYDSESDEYIGQNLSDLLPSKEYSKIQAGIDTGNSFSVTTKKEGSSTKVVRYYSPISAAGQTWWAASALNRSDLLSKTIVLVVLMVIISLIALGVIIIISSRLVSKYIKPINGVVEVADRLAMGDFSARPESVYSDEIGMLSNKFSEMSERLNEIIKDISRGLNEMAAGNFNIAPAVEHVGDFKEIEDSLVKVLQDLSKTLSEINSVADMVAANASQLSDGAQSITEGATDQASSVQELQSTIANVSDQVDMNAHNANVANEMAKKVGDEIIESNTQMQEIVRAMDIINENSKQVSSIINTINDIASSTNLLALNASIEAARAGEEGRGFAVVATQVGNLAAQSAEAAKNSGELILQAINAIEDGKQMVDIAADKLMASVEKTKELVENIGEISLASEQQSESLKQISEAASQIAAVVEENTAMAEESSASSEELASQADRLKELVGAFKLLDQ